VHSTAEICVPVWCRSVHTCLTDPTINDALIIVTGCLRPSPAVNLPILLGIQPVKLRGVTLSLARRAKEPRHLLHSALTCAQSANARCFKSRNPFVHAAQQLISFSDSNNDNIRAAPWVDHQWNAKWLDNPTRLCTLINTPATPSRNDSRRTTWVRLNRLRPGVERFHCCLYRWDMASSRTWECDAEEQTVDHLVLQCPIHRPPHGLHLWRFWTMRQSNGCLTLAARSSAAYQWFEELDQKKTKKPREFCYRTVLTAACYWLSSNCISTQNCVSVSADLHHNRSPLVFISDKGVCCHRSSSWSKWIELTVSRWECHYWKLQDQPFTFCARFGPARIVWTWPPTCTLSVFCPVHKAGMKIST